MDFSFYLADLVLNLRVFSSAFDGGFFFFFPDGIPAYLAGYFPHTLRVSSRNSCGFDPAYLAGLTPHTLRVPAHFTLYI